MKFRSVLGKEVELTLERKQHILAFHPDLKPYFKFIKEVLENPDDIRISKSDESVLLFYRYFATIKNGKYIAVTVKTNQRWFILTSYFTKHKISGRIYKQSL